LSQEEIERRTAEALRLDARRSAELWEDVWTEYLGTLNEELLKFVSALRPRYKTAILSNSFVGAREREQEHYRFQDHFDAILYSHEEALRSHIGPLHAGLRPAWRPAPRAVFVDDLAENVEGAENLGDEGPPVHID
jgi:putative hydrolase of the HAD superfamily